MVRVLNPPPPHPRAAQVRLVCWMAFKDVFLSVFLSRFPTPNLALAPPLYSNLVFFPIFQNPHFMVYPVYLTPVRRPSGAEQSDPYELLEVVVALLIVIHIYIHKHTHIYIHIHTYIRIHTYIHGVMPVTPITPPQLSIPLFPYTC
jgi:hypothetical protein